MRSCLYKAAYLKPSLATPVPSCTDFKPYVLLGDQSSRSFHALSPPVELVLLRWQCFNARQIPQGTV